MHKPLFQFENIALGFREDRPLFREVNLTVERGDLIIVRGASGSGKSSFLRLLNRIQDPSAGRILFEGRSIEAPSVASLRRRVAYIHQTPALIEDTIAANLLLPFRFKACREIPIPSKDDLRSLLARFLSADLALDEPAGTLSVGQKQRLCLIRSLLLRPEVLLPDEPTSALDPESAAIVEREILRANVEDGVTVVMATHRPSAVYSSDRIRHWRLHNRRIEEC